MNRLFVDFHVIQTVPPSCINRDDTGSPKTAVYGGVKRARVSSQCWKHAMRDLFRKYYEPSSLGVRTIKGIPLLAGAVREQDPSQSEEQALQLAQTVMESLNLKPVAKKKKKSDADEESSPADSYDLQALFFIGHQQLQNLASLALSADFTDKKTVSALKQTLNECHAVDVALFGRMVAADPSLNCDASSQVAHAISTHAVRSEFDFFTGMDDLQAEDTAGATMLGTIEFNSATLYRYATVAVHELHHQLAGDPDATATAIAEFARAFTLSMPTGKQNTFANHTPPSALLVSLREDCPVNLVGAFEQAVTTRDGNGYLKNSVEKLALQAKQLYQSFVNEPVQVYVVGSGLEEFAPPISMSTLLETVREDVARRCQ